MKAELRLQRQGQLRPTHLHRRMHASVRDGFLIHTVIYTLMQPGRGARAQSAMEYLTTYGWMVLILAVVLVALYTFGFFNTTPSFCDISASFSCQDYFLGSNGVLSVTILQSTSSQINVTGIACTENTTPKFQTLESAPQNSGSSQTYTVQCYTQSGSAYSGTAGSVYKGSIDLRYTNTFTGYLSTVYGSFETTATGAPISLSTETSTVPETLCTNTIISYFSGTISNTMSFGYTLYGGGGGGTDGLAGSSGSSATGNFMATAGSTLTVYVGGGGAGGGYYGGGGGGSGYYGGGGGNGYYVGGSGGGGSSAILDGATVVQCASGGEGANTVDGAGGGGAGCSSGGAGGASEGYDAGASGGLGYGGGGGASGEGNGNGDSPGGANGGYGGNTISGGSGGGGGGGGGYGGGGGGGSGGASGAGAGGSSGANGVSHGICTGGTGGDSGTGGGAVSGACGSGGNGGSVTLTWYQSGNPSCLLSES